MKKETNLKLEECLSDSVVEYYNIHISSDEKAKTLGILSKEIKMLREDDSARINDELKKEKQAFDLERSKKQLELEKSKARLEEKKWKHQVTVFEHTKELEMRKLEIEIKKLEIENKKIELEYAKLTIGKEAKIKEEKKEKRTFFLNIITKSAEIFVPLVINTALVLMNFRLIYADDGRVPSEMKDLMKNVYRK